MCHIKREYTLALAPVVQVHFPLTFSRREKMSNIDETNVVLSSYLQKEPSVEIPKALGTDTQRDSHHTG